MKTLFGSSDRSNFIQNMKPAAYRRYCLMILLGLLPLMGLLALPGEFVPGLCLTQAALTVGGGAALLFVLIGLMRRFLPGQALVLGILLAALTGCGLVSTLCSFSAGDPLNYDNALFGTYGRGSGLLTLVCNACIFLIGTQLDANQREKLLHGMLLYGLFQCVWGLLQALPIGFVSAYQNLEPLMEYRVFLPSGLTGSPIFLATLLVLLEFPAMLLAAFAEDKRRRIPDLVCCAAFAVMAVKTQCLIGIAGMGLAILLGGIYLLWNKSGKHRKTALFTAVIAFVCGLGWWLAAPLLNGTYNDLSPSSGIVCALYDGSIMWRDSAYRLDVSGYYVPEAAASPHGTFEIDSIPSVYGYLWSQTAEIIRKYPLTGTGPDSLIYPQLFNSLTPLENPNTFDLSYNAYLQTAATLGIPALLLLLAVLVQIFVLGGRACTRDVYSRAALLGAVLLYAVIMVTGAESVTVTPLFWAIAGALCAKPESPVSSQ